MTLTNSQRQARFRERARKAVTALEAILPLVEGKTGPVAQAVAKLAREGLGKDETCPRLAKPRRRNTRASPDTSMRSATDIGEAGK